MNKPERSQPHHAVNGDGSIKKDRYYVQSLTERIFLVRECLSAGGESGPDDRIVRSFDVYHDANSYAHSMNDQLAKPDSAAAPDAKSHFE